MACSMEEGVKGKGALQIYFEEQSKRPTWREQNRILGLSFQEKRVPPLQAADILAYELYKKSERQFGKVTLADRYPLKVLGTKNHQWLYFQKKHLREYSEDVDRQIAQFSSDSAT